MNPLWENMQMTIVLTFNPPSNLKLLFNQFNELTAESNKTKLESFINCKNLGIDEMQKMKIYFLYPT